MENIENSPGTGALVAMKDLNKDLVFKKPNSLPRKRRKEKVLDEETYIEASYFSSNPST